MPPPPPPSLILVYSYILSYFFSCFIFHIQYTMTMLEDPVPVVRATAVRSLRALLGMVTSFPPSDSNIFLLYIFPALQVRFRDCVFLIWSPIEFCWLLDSASRSGSPAESVHITSMEPGVVDGLGLACGKLACRLPCGARGPASTCPLLACGPSCIAPPVWDSDPGPLMALLVSSLRTHAGGV